VDEAAQPARHLGYWATAAWAVVAFLVGQFVALAVVVWWRVGRISAVLDTPYDGELVTLFILIANPITMALLALAARLARFMPADYLGLKWPKPSEAMTDVAWLIGLIALGDALLYAGGRELVTSFQVGLGPPGALGLARHYRHFHAVGGAAHPVRLGRRVADFRHRPVPRLGASALGLDAADVLPARFVQSRRLRGNRAVREVLFVMPQRPG
jgi:hypothetical protein